MSSLNNFFESDFNTQREEWEKALLAELKLTEVGNKASKKMVTGMTWPTLSLDRKSEVQLTPKVEWKKAAATYAVLKDQEIESALQEDLKSGVRNFFFYEESLAGKNWDKILTVLENYPHANELEIFVLGTSKKFTSKKIKVISGIVSGKEAHDQGAHSIQELAYLAKNLINHLSDEVYVGVYVDSHFFHNIAKLRAARLIAEKIIAESGKKSELKIVALTSFQGWTLFERYSNMLRNETAVASAYIGGADHIQSSGYNTLLELETEGEENSEHTERSLRMGRNTSHILALESMLGVVQDAAYGSYHLENLTEALCEEAWKLMQRLLSGEDISSEIQDVRTKKLDMMKTRKTVMSGINDFPDVKETLHVRLKAPVVFRPARAFEELRLRMENIKKPEVYIALYGDYGALNARLSFVKNYFELLGLTVHAPSHSVTELSEIQKNLASRKEAIIVLCSSDEEYPTLVETAGSVKIEHKFIAGKFEMASYKNLFAGQNVYEVLHNLVVAFEGRNV